MVANQCHAYRNATYMGAADVSRAIRTLSTFKFVGLQEAYRSSVLLLGATFNFSISASDFARDRESKDHKRPCTGYRQREFARDVATCRKFMAANWQDVVVFEAVHRLFCRRLADAGLMSHPDVRRELGQGWVCSEVDTSSPEAYCALLLSPKVSEAGERWGAGLFYVQ